MTQPIDLIAFTHLTLVLILFPSLSYYFFLKRNEYPIKARMPRVVLLFNLFLMVFCVHVFCYTTVKGYPCWAALVPDLFTKIFAVFTYVYRGFTLLFHSEIAKNLIDIQEGKVKTLGWFVTHRRWISSQIFSYMFLLLFTLCSLYTLLILYLEPSMQSATCFRVLSSDDNTYTQTRIFNYVVIVLALPLIWISFRLRSHSDGFRIKTELKLTTFFEVLILVGYTVIDMTTAWSFSLGALGGWTPFLLSTAWPLCMYHQDKRARNRERDKAVSVIPLRQLLHSPKGFELFLRFIQKEFSAENVLFWREVEHYKSTVDPAQSYEIATLIRSQYIERDAPFQVNLPAKITEEVLKSLDALTPHEAVVEMFDSAQLETYLLMESDSYKRFVLSEDYRHFYRESQSSISDTALRMLRQPLAWDLGLSLTLPNSSFSINNGQLSRVSSMHLVRPHLYERSHSDSGSFTSPN